MTDKGEGGTRMEERRETKGERGGERREDKERHAIISKVSMRSFPTFPSTRPHLGDSLALHAEPLNGPVARGDGRLEAVRDRVGTDASGNYFFLIF